MTFPFSSDEPGQRRDRLRMNRPCSSGPNTPMNAHDQCSARTYESLKQCESFPGLAIKWPCNYGRDWQGVASSDQRRIGFARIRVRASNITNAKYVHDRPMSFAIRPISDERFDFHRIGTHQYWQHNMIATNSEQCGHGSMHQRGQRIAMKRWQDDRRSQCPGRSRI
jgi:hypothetical protein